MDNNIKRYHFDIGFKSKENRDLVLSKGLAFKGISLKIKKVQHARDCTQWVTIITLPMGEDQ